MLKKAIKKILLLERDFYQKSVDVYFERNLEKDIAVFQRLHPCDDFGRSIAQHKCQIYPFKKDVFLLNTMSLVLIPFVTIMLLLKKRALIKSDSSTIVCYNCFNLPGSLPEALSDKDVFVLINSDCPYYLNRGDIPFLLRFFLRSICYPFLAFRVLLKVAKYRAIIDSFSNLEAITITGEFSDTSSAMTQYCHERGIKHYNFMQGDMLGSPRIAFFHFDKCFVWNQYYADLFMTFGASQEQFEVSIPNCLQKIEGSHTSKAIDYTYYVGGFPGEDLQVIRAYIDKLIAKGFVCEVRPHPRWSNMEIVNTVFKGLSIQDTSLISVNESILMTKNVIGLCSTVLLQAYYNGVRVVIDDISSPDKFKMLEGYKYIMLNKPHDLLSELTNF